MGGSVDGSLPPAKFRKRAKRGTTCLTCVKRRVKYGLEEAYLLRVSRTGLGSVCVYRHSKSKELVKQPEGVRFYYYPEELGTNPRKSCKSCFTMNKRCDFEKLVCARCSYYQEECIWPRTRSEHALEYRPPLPTSLRRLLHSLPPPSMHQLSAVESRIRDQGQVAAKTPHRIAASVSQRRVDSSGTRNDHQQIYKDGI